MHIQCPKTKQGSTEKRKQKCNSILGGYRPDLLTYIRGGDHTLLNTSRRASCITELSSTRRRRWRGDAMPAPSVLSICGMEYSTGPSQGLKIRGGVRSTVVGIICPPVEIGLTVCPPPTPLLATALEYVWFWPIILHFRTQPACFTKSKYSQM